MKTFLLNIPQRLKLKSQELDAQAVLCGKMWTVFNDEGISQRFIFRPDGSLFITTNGEVTHSTWMFLPENGSIIITSPGKSTMYHPTFLDEIVFALQQDGIESVLFLIDENNERFKPETLTELRDYFSEKEQALIDEQNEEEEDYEDENEDDVEEEEEEEEVKATGDNKDNEDKGEDDLEVFLRSALISIPVSFFPGFVVSLASGGSVLLGMIMSYPVTLLIVTVICYALEKRENEKCGYSVELPKNLTVPSTVKLPKNLTIPSTVKVINARQYQSQHQLISVIFPETLTAIEEFAFEDCCNLTSVSLPPSLSEIGSGAFKNCSKLASVSIPNSVRSIEIETFSGCSSITSIEVPDSVTEIWHFAFNGCSRLTSITIPDSVTFIGQGVFDGCINLQKIRIKNQNLLNGSGLLPSVEIITS